MKTLMSLIALVAISLTAQQSQAEIFYNLSTNTTTHSDSARLVSGYFTTNGDTGLNQKLGGPDGILTDFRIEIEESGTTVILLPGNTVFGKNHSLFNVTANSISLAAGDGFFHGIQIELDVEQTNPPRFAVLRTGDNVNSFVSVTGGAGTLTGTPATITFATAVPEPTSFLTFSLISMFGLVRRRSKI